MTAHAQLVLAEEHQLELQFEGDSRRSAAALDRRGERREATVRQVRFTPFPRAASGAGERVGLRRDASASGMALGADDALPVGSLVRVIVQQVDGRPDHDAVARVAWCHEDEKARPGAPRAWHGLEYLAEVRRGMARVPSHPREPVRRTLPEAV